MQSKKPNKNQLSFLSPTLREQLNSKQELYLLSEQIKWTYFEDEFGSLYSDQGRPAHPIRLMVSLLILKALYNLSDGGGRLSSKDAATMVAKAGGKGNDLIVLAGGGGSESGGNSTTTGNASTPLVPLDTLASQATMPTLGGSMTVYHSVLMSDSSNVTLTEDRKIPVKGF